MHQGDPSVPEPAHTREGPQPFAPRPLHTHLDAHSRSPTAVSWSFLAACASLSTDQSTAESDSSSCRRPHRRSAEDRRVASTPAHAALKGPCRPPGPSATCSMTPETAPKGGAQGIVPEGRAVANATTTPWPWAITTTKHGPTLCQLSRPSHQNAPCTAFPPKHPPASSV